MVFLSLGVSGALALAITWFGYRKASAGLRTKSELALGSEALLGSTLIENWMTERTVALRGVAGLRSVRTVLDTAVSLARDDVDATNLVLSDIASVAPELESIEVIDLRGAAIAGTTDEVEKGLLRRPEVKSALAGREYISGISTSPTSGAPCVYTAVPARGSNGTVVGVVRARESIERMQSLVAAAPDRIDAPELASVPHADERRIFDWKVEGVAHVAVSEPLRRTGWTYAAALPVSVVESEARSFLRRATAFAVVGLLAGFLLSMLVSRRVVRSIRKLIEASRRIVERNDLTQRIESDSDDEVGQLADSFSLMVDALRNALTALQATSSSLVDAAEQLRETTEAERELLNRQATALQETQVTAQEIKQTSALAAEKARMVVQAADQADQIGRSGEGAVQESINGLASIQTQSSEIGSRIQTLSDSARQIGGITDTVKDLADQSNMLALNAAIEAVRSGEHGKGFAVVARQIRSLADQSIEATRRVREALEDVSRAIGTAVAISRAGEDRVDRGLSQVKASGDNLRALSDIVKDSIAAAVQIAEVVNQQDAGIRQIFTAVSELSETMDQTLKRMEATGAAAGAVEQVSEKVSKLVDRYRV